MRYLKILGLLLLAIIAMSLVALTILAFLPTKTAPIEGSNSIAVVERIKLGGVEQAVLIRGVDRRKPVLLYVHGGPGMGMLPVTPYWSAELEKHFVVVAWDQRGAGASCTPEVPASSLTLDQIVSDTLELATILGKRFGPDEKIYLLGHSWGSVISTLAVQRQPEAFHAYIGLGQAVHGARNEELSYQFVLQEAMRRDDAVGLAELKAISPPPYGRPEDFETQRRWLVAYGGTVYDTESARGALWPALFGREYSLSTRMRIFPCMQRSMDAMWHEFLDIDFYEQVPRLDVPVYLLMGRHDYNTPFELAVAWADQLIAPKVEVIWLEGVAHLALLENRQAFQRALIDRVLAGTPPPGSDHD